MRNRVVVVTGASSGIGAAAALKLAQSSRVMLVARRQDRLEEIAQKIEADGGAAACCVADLTKPESVAQVIDATLDAFGEIDALINNAGVFQTANVGSYTPQHLSDLLTLNFTAAVMLTQAALPYLQKENGGWVVNVSSVAASRIFPGCSVYGATKAALDQWSATIREELREQGVRVSVVAPGATYTEVWGADHPSAAQMARAEDVADAIEFCLNQAPSASIDKLVVTPPGGAL